MTNKTYCPLCMCTLYDKHLFLNHSEELVQRSKDPADPLMAELNKRGIALRFSFDSLGRKQLDALGANG